jgi:predicted nucleotidyltransferase
MGKKRTTSATTTANRLQFAEHSLAAIRRFARGLGERFHPDKIILFGSYAYGIPRPDSDVDLLVVMPARNELDQAYKIDLAIDPPPLPVHIIVRTPKNVAVRLADGDSFLREVFSKGKVLYRNRVARPSPASQEAALKHRLTPPLS